jgi:ketosteroid isomerase-like protein
MAQHEERLRAFFVRYGDALAAGDLPTIAESYTVPALVLSDAGSISVATREEVEAAFRGAAEGYRAQRSVSARPTILGFEAITGRLMFADVRWDYLDEQGSSVRQEGYRYLLRMDDEAGPQIQVVIVTPL